MLGPPAGDDPAGGRGATWLKRPARFPVASPQWRRVAAVALPIGIYVALSIVTFWPIGPLDPHTLPLCNCGDYAKMTAFLEWTPWAILHGHNPFLTSYQDYPVGVNLATNTTMPVLGIVLAPVSLTAGPIAAMNLLAHLALCGSATTAFLVLRSWTRWVPAAFVGGLLFGFSPYVIAHSFGHPNLIFLVVLPLLMYLVDEVFVRQRWSARRGGLLLGLAAAVQYGISSELMADAVLVAIAALLLAALLRRSEVRRRVAHSLRAVGWSLVTFVPLLAYPVYLVIAGPGHLTGPVQAASALNKLRADLLGALLPTRVMLFSLGSIGTKSQRFANANFVENAVYIGLPLIIILTALTIRYRRDTRLVVMSLMVVACYIASLGGSLNVDGRDTGVPLPFRVLPHIPLLDGAIAVRFFAYGYLFVAAALAIGLDHLRGTAAVGAPGGAPAGAATGLTGPGPAPADLAAEDLSGAGAPPGRRGRLRLDEWGRPAFCGLVAVVGLVPLIPRLPLPHLASYPTAVYGSYPVPAYFQPSGGEQAIPNGTAVLVYPYTTQGYNVYDVLWQAEGAYRFRLTDGDVTAPDRQGVGTSDSPYLQPPMLENLLLNAYYGRPQHTRTLFPRLDEAALGKMRAVIERYGYSTIVVVPVGRYPAVVVRAITAALGRRPARSGGVYVWYGVQRDLRALDPT